MSLDHDAIWQDLMQDALDGALPPSELVRFKSHLTECSRCAADYDRLRLLDARLLRDVSATSLAPSAAFDTQVLTSIARIEADKRARAKQREQADYAARIGQLKKTLRFSVGSWVAALATLFAVMMAVDVGPVARFLRDWYSLANPAWAVAGALGIAAASICAARSMDRR
jgi:predicted anti-sigma-YlaC factor YlaD